RSDPPCSASVHTDSQLWPTNSVPVRDARHPIDSNDGSTSLLRKAPSIVVFLARNFDRNRFAHRRSLRLTLNLDFRTDQLRDLFPEALDREACVLLSNDFTGCSFAGMRIKAEGELGLIGGLRGRKLSVGDPRFGDVS